MDTEEDLEFLKRRISIIEWDLGHMKDGEMRSTKQSRLLNHKREFEMILKRKQKELVGAII